MASADMFYGSGPASTPIWAWVQSKIPDFAKALDDLGLEAMLGTATHMNAQLTFLVPPADVRKGYIAEAKSADHAGALFSKFGAFIIPVGLKSASDFVAENNSGGLGNARGLRFSSVSQKGSDVFINGVRLAPVADFNSRHRFAIWTVEGDATPLLAEPNPTAIWHYRRKRSAAAGAQVKGGSADRATRETIRQGAKMLRKKFLDGLSVAVGAAGGAVTALDVYSADPYLGFCLCLFDELKSTGKLAEARERGLLDLNPLITFELIARPEFAVGAFDSEVIAAFSSYADGAGPAAAVATVDAFLAEVGEGGCDLAAYLLARDAVPAGISSLAALRAAYAGKTESLWADTVRDALGNYLFDVLTKNFVPGETIEFPLSSCPRNSSYDEFLEAVYGGSGLVRGDGAAAVKRFVESTDFKHTRLSAAGVRELMAKLAAGGDEADEYRKGLVQNKGEWMRDVFAAFILSILARKVGGRAHLAVRRAAATLKHALRASKAGKYGGGAGGYLGGARAAIDDLAAYAGTEGGC
jgi:hypothetical protein